MPARQKIGRRAQLISNKVDVFYICSKLAVSFFLFSIVPRRKQIVEAPSVVKVYGASIAFRIFIYYTMVDTNVIQSRRDAGERGWEPDEAHQIETQQLGQASVG